MTIHEEAHKRTQTYCALNHIILDDVDKHGEVVYSPEAQEIFNNYCKII